MYNFFMPIISNQTNFFYEKHFVFSGKDILLCNLGNSRESVITEKNLPDENILRKIFSAQIASDWFSETDLNYNAVLLEKDAPVPEGCSLIPIREFFWETKSSDERKSAEPSSLGSLSARAYGLLKLREQYRFCPKCAGKLSDDTHFSAKRCTSCGNIIFPRIEPAVIVLVTKGEKILLAKNKNRSYNFWSCISGFIELGENAEQAVRREVMEETGLTVKNIQYKGSQSWPFPDELMLAFTAEWESGEIRIQEEELDAAQWFSRDALPDLPRPGSVAYNLVSGLF